MSQVATIGALGMMLGPVIGGFITTNLSWHWIFWVNIPVGLFGIVLAHYWLENTEPQVMPPLDKRGFILFGAAFAGFTYGLSAISEPTVSLFTSLSIIVISMLLNRRANL